MAREIQLASGNYTFIVAEVYYDPARRRNGVRPTSGEAFPQSMKVECAQVIKGYPLGTKVRLPVKETTKENGKPFLYSSYKWNHEVI